MAIRYVWMDSLQDDSDATWNSSTLAYLTLQAALTAYAAGDIIYVASIHTEALGATTEFTCAAATAVRPCPIYSVNKTNDSYLAATTVQINGGNGGYDIEWDFSCAVYGLYIEIGDDWWSFNVANDVQYWEECTFEGVAADGSHSYFYLAGKSMYARYVRCKFYGSDDPDGLMLIAYGTADLIDCVWDGHHHDAGAFVTTFSETCNVKFIGCDFSDCDTTTKYLFLANAGYEEQQRIQFINCKLPTLNGGVIRGTFFSNEQRIELIGSDQDDDAYRREIHSKSFSIVQNTSIYLDYEDKDQTTGLSHEWALTETVYQHTSGLMGFPIYGWVGSTGSKTFTVHVAHDYSSNLQNDELWMEVYFMDNASYSKLDMVETRMALLGTPADVTTEAQTWTGNGGLTDQKITLTETVGKAGLYMVKVFLKKYEAGKKLYVDPLVVIS